MCDREECWSGDASVRRQQDRYRIPSRPWSECQADDEMIADCMRHAVDWRDRARVAEERACKAESRAEAMREALDMAQTAMADAGLQVCCSVAWDAVCAALEERS